MGKQSSSQPSAGTAVLSQLAAASDRGGQLWAWLLGCQGHSSSTIGGAGSGRLAHGKGSNGSATCQPSYAVAKRPVGGHGDGGNQTAKMSLIWQPNHNWIDFLMLPVHDG
jgi:hypothetical protein